MVAPILVGVIYEDHAVSSTVRVVLMIEERNDSRVLVCDRVGDDILTKCHLPLVQRLAVRAP